MYRLFLADDEPWVIISLKKMIDWGKEGFIICGEATDGIKALERILHTKPDLIISDVKMPGMDGIELIRKIREENINADLIFLSGYSEFEYAKAAIKYGCTDYLLKPIEEDELLDCLDKIRNKLQRDKVIEQNQFEESDGYRSDSRIVKEMLQYMQENYSTVTQQHLVEKFNMSVTAVSLLIKRKTGESYSNHLLGIRIKKAEELLRLTNYSVEKISQMVGYSDYFYFLKVFKKATGISPAAFRKNLS